MVWLLLRQAGQPVQCLLLRLIPSRGGGWHPVTGAVEKKETIRAGALREIDEETGLKLEDSQLIDLELKQEFEGRWGPAKEHAFMVAIDWESAGKHPFVKTDRSEHLGLKWMNFEDAVVVVEHSFHRESLVRAFERARKEPS